MHIVIDYILLKNQFQGHIIPAIFEISKIIDNMSEHKDKVKTYQSSQTSSCTELIQKFFQNNQPPTYRTPKYKQHRQLINVTETFPDHISNSQ